jgi:hypothetical protein
MKLVIVLAMLAGVACADRPAVPTSPSATAPVSSLAMPAPGDENTAQQADVPSLSASSARTGDLLVTKECSAYTGAAGSFCTITSSNLKAIEVGTRIVYAQAAGATSLDSDVVLDTPGPGNNIAFGHCTLDLATSSGLCTLSGGTGKFTWLYTSAVVSFDSTTGLWHWEGTYSFSPHD